MKIKKTKKYVVEFSSNGEEFVFYGGHLAALHALKACKREGLVAALRRLPKAEWRY